MDNKQAIEIGKEMLHAMELNYNEIDSHGNENTKNGQLDLLHKQMKALTTLLKYTEAVYNAANELPERLKQGMILSGVDITSPEYDLVILWHNKCLDAVERLVARNDLIIQEFTQQCNQLGLERDNLRRELYTIKQAIQNFEIPEKKFVDEYFNGQEHNAFLDFIIPELAKLTALANVEQKTEAALDIGSTKQRPRWQVTLEANEDGRITTKEGSFLIENVAGGLVVIKE